MIIIRVKIQKNKFLISKLKASDLQKNFQESELKGSDFKFFRKKSELRGSDLKLKNLNRNQEVPKHKFL